MKKNLYALLILGIACVLLFSFSGCEKLKVSNLKGNYHLKQANRFYQEELYRKAVEAYEVALSYNPNLKQAYIYLGTSCSQVYRPMKQDDPYNDEFGKKAEQYLLKALEFEPDREEVIIALGDFYDKKGNTEEAEKYYKMILDKNKDDPKSFYTLANFYQNSGNTEKAESMYLQRIELDPKDPEGYQYFIGFLRNQRRWQDLILNHEKLLYSMLDSSIIDLMKEIELLAADMKQVEDSTKYMEMVKKNKKVDKAEKERLLTEAQENIKDMLPLDEAQKKMDELLAQLDQKKENAEATIPSVDDETKRKVIENYYSMGVVYWNWSYQTPSDMMDPKVREELIKKGMASLEKAIELNPQYAEPYSYIGLLWREMIKVDPLKRDEFVKKNEEFIKKFNDIFKKKKRAEEYKKQLEGMGQEEGK